MDKIPILKIRQASSCIHFHEVAAELGVCPTEVTTSLVTQGGGGFFPSQQQHQDSNQQCQDFLSSIVFS